MSQVNVLKKDGQAAGEVALQEKIFGARINRRLLDEVIRFYANNKRTGTVCTKTFGEVRGGGRKPWKQKGTGRARTSSIRNPLWRGGGTIFGPRPREILFSIPKRTRLQAILSALSVRHGEGRIIVVDDASLESPKTKLFYEMLKALKLTEGSALCLVEDLNETLKRASHNVPRVTVRSIMEFNAYHVMKKKMLLIEQKALPVLEKRLEEVLS